MFLSINKKIIYSISILLILTSSIFTYSFYEIYLKNMIAKEKNSTIQITPDTSVLYENIVLKNELIELLSENKTIIISEAAKNLIGDTDYQLQLDKLANEKLKIQETIKNYDHKYSTINEAFKVFIASAVLIFMFIILTGLLLKKWVIAPLDKLSDFSSLVSENLFSIRLNIPKENVIRDEFYNLYKTFNNMLDNIENNISEIKSKEEFLQSLIDNIPDGIRVIDEKGNITTANKQYYKQVGASESHIMQKCYKSSQNLDKACPKSLFTCPLNEIFLNKAKSTKTIQYFANKPNNQLYINSAPLIINKNNKKQQYIVEVIRDLSEDIRFSHQQKLSSIGFLATAVAHEMKNNLGSIRIIMEGIIDKIDNNKIKSEEIKNYLEMVNSQVIDSISVPERLLKLSRLSQEDLKEINCFDNINDIVKLLDYEAKSQGIKVNIEAKDEKTSIMATDGDLKIVFINLLQNAFKAMKKGGNINIKIEKIKDKAEISITDTGIGINKKQIKYIFDPFYSDGVNTNKTGNGLGLPITKSIVEKFRGTIRVSSKENVGTTFTLSFPCIKKDLHN